MSVTISANVLVRNEIKHVDAFVRNMIDACIDEVVFLDGGSSDGTYERLLEYKVKYSHIRVLHWEKDTSLFIKHDEIIGDILQYKLLLHL